MEYINKGLTCARRFLFVNGENSGCFLKNTGSCSHKNLDQLLNDSRRAMMKGACRKRKAVDGDSSAYDLTEMQLEELGLHREKLVELQAQLEDAIEHIRDDDHQRPHLYIVLLARVTERLAILQKFPALAICASHANICDEGMARASGGDAMIDQDKAFEDIKESAEDTETDEDDVDGEASEDDHENEAVDDDLEMQPYHDQAKRAKQQLVSFQDTVLRQRLLMAERRLQAIANHATTASSEGDSLSDIREEVSKGFSITDLEAGLDEAIRLMTRHPAPYNQRQVAATSEAVLSLADIQAVIQETHACLDIQNALEKGIVKPFFHTLLLPETFLHSRRSYHKVTAGQVDTGRTLEFDELCRNMNDAVDASGKAALSIKDCKLGRSWCFSRRQTDFAVELVNTHATMLGEDIECTPLSFISITLGPGSRMPLLTRPETRGIVAETFHRFRKKAGDNGSVSAIVGTPGIGKSWTLFYALQQALHYDGASVLFFFLKRNATVLYLRRNHQIYAWTSKCETASSDLFDRSDVVVLVDPKEARQGGADFISGNVKLIYAATNDENHFKGPAEKDYGKIRAYLGPPPDNELMVLVQQLEPSLTLCDIQERKKHIGNLIRYLLDEEKYSMQNNATTSAINECKEDGILQRALNDDGMSGERTVGGALFHVLPRRPPPTQASIGYDGQNVDYRELVVQAATAQVRKAIVKGGREPVLSYWGKVGDGDEYATMSQEARQLFLCDLMSPSGMVLKRFLLTSDKSIKGQESHLVVKSGMVALRDVDFDGPCMLCAAVLLKTNIVVNVINSIPLLIDAAGPGHKLFQVATSSRPCMNIQTMSDICKAMGYTGENGRVIPEDRTKTLEFYWVVPQAMVQTWNQKGPFTFPKCKGRKVEDNENRKLINIFLKRHVKQYVLPMTCDIPPAYDEALASTFHP